MRSGPPQSQDYLIDVVVKELTPFWTVNYGPQSAVIVPNIGVWGQPLRNFSIYRRMLPRSVISPTRLETLETFR